MVTSRHLSWSRLIHNPDNVVFECINFRLSVLCTISELKLIDCAVVN